MDLYFSLFNSLEESGKMERRDFLRSGVTGAAYLATGGVMDKAKVSEEKLDEMYIGGFPGYDKGRPNMPVDVIEVGDNYLQQEVIDLAESLYDDNGINAIISRREQKYSETSFQRHYGGDAARILGTDGYKGFIGDQISSQMQDSAIQVVMSPGKVEDPRGWLEYEGMERTGFATDSVALGADTAFEEGYPSDHIRGKALVLLHELGHTHDLKHSDDPSNVMHKDVNIDADLDYSPDQWDQIRSSI